MSMMVSFVLSFFPRDVLDEILNLIESVSEDFPSYSFKKMVSLLSAYSLGIIVFSSWQIYFTAIKSVCRSMRPTEEWL